MCVGPGEGRDEKAAWVADTPLNEIDVNCCTIRKRRSYVQAFLEWLTRGAEKLPMASISYTIQDPHVSTMA